MKRHQTTDLALLTYPHISHEWQKPTWIRDYHAMFINTLGVAEWSKVLTAVPWPLMV